MEYITLGNSGISVSCLRCVRRSRTSLCPKTRHWQSFVPGLRRALIFWTMRVTMTAQDMPRQVGIFQSLVRAAPVARRMQARGPNSGEQAVAPILSARERAARGRGFALALGSVLFAATSAAQVQENVGALQVLPKLTDEVMTRLSGLE